MLELLEQISQIAIFIFGATSIYLVNSKGKYFRYGCIAGLLCQPFWFYTAIYNNQTGVIVVNFIFTYFWAMGFYNHWIKNTSKKEIKNKRKIKTKV